MKLGQINANSLNYKRWYRILSQFCQGFRKWNGDTFEGVTASCNGNYINRLAITDGHVYAFKVKDTLYITRASRQKFNYMFLPESIKVVNPYINYGVEMNFTVNSDCVYIPLTSDGKPLHNIISAYASRLARYEDDMYMNSIFTRSQFIVKAPDDMTAQKVRKMFDDLVDGEMGIISDDNMFSKIFDENGLQTLSSNFQFLGYEYLEMIRETLRELAEIMGINSSGANLIKKERNTNDEVNSNNEIIEVFRTYANDETQKAVDRVNELFGTNITITYGAGVQNDEINKESVGNAEDMATDETGTEVDQQQGND